jgi:purine nucleoside phosphorylase
VCTPASPARHLGLRCLCLSLITNLSATVGADHDEVLAAGQAAAHQVERLLRALLDDEETYRLASSQRPE